MKKLLSLLSCLLLFGCGEKKEVSDAEDSDEADEFIAAVNDTLARLEKSAAKKAEGINEDQLDFRGESDFESVAYLKGSNTPYTGKAYSLGAFGIRSEGMFKEGLREGVLTKWYGNGTKGSEVTFKNGIRESALTWTVEGEWESKIIFGPEGLVTWFYKSGQKESEGAVESDQISQRGVWTYWYENGQKKQEGSYRDGVREGLWTDWYDNGQKEIEVTWKDGSPVFGKQWLPDGRQIRDGSGKLMMKTGGSQTRKP